MVTRTPRGSALWPRAATRRSRNTGLGHVAPWSRSGACQASPPCGSSPTAASVPAVRPLVTSPPTSGHVPLSVSHVPRPGLYRARPRHGTREVTSQGRAAHVPRPRMHWVVTSQQRLSRRRLCLTCGLLRLAL
eukprot:3156378-Rhodomonas_salina.1